ncbi:MAG TPA: 30S ribosomal protein S7, partial [Anaerolineaceae bacterium]|nr:30S ribosomal protein S7 [Anaerolineaceae bacterium]
MRRTKPEKREVPPDIRYGNVFIQTFIHQIMGRGKKSTATTLMYDALDLVQEKTGRNAVEVFEQALKNVG